MKPTDKAIDAGYEASANSANGSVFGRVSRSTMKEILTAAYAAQFQSEDYAGLIEELREDLLQFDLKDTDYENTAKEAADALEALMAERAAWKGRQEATAAILKRIETERDALAARLAPVDDKVLVEIAAVAIRRNKFERTGRLDCFDPSNLTPEELGEGRAAIAAIRPHIEAAEREKYAKKIEPAGPRPCNCDSCDCGNKDDAERVAAWDEAMANAAAIRSGK